MPELPEVETVVRELSPQVVGICFADLRVFDPRLAHLEGFALRGFSVSQLSRFGKYIVFTLRGPKQPEKYLAIHLRMTGRLFWLEENTDADDSPLQESLHARIPYVHEVSLKPAHIRFSISAEGGSLVFADPRRFGTVELIDSPESLLSGGIDPTKDNFTTEALAALLAKGKQPLKTWLLRQDRLVGVGNIYASEILYRAKLHPFRATGNLKKQEISALHQATREILLAAIERNGTTFSDFQKPSGETGGFQDFLQVYERENEECASCGKPIERVTQAGRSTYFCPRCQKGAPRRKKVS